MDHLELERRIIGALAPRGEVLEAYLFGSRAAGRAQAHSDTDIAVFVDEHALRASTTREGYALSRYCDFVPQLAKIEAARRGARGGNGRN